MPGNYITGGGGGDFLSELLSAEVALNSATVLTASAFGIMHVLSGASNYTVTLPPVATHAGEFVGFRVAPGTTALITLDGNAAELIDGSTTRIVWENEVAILMCDGSRWIKIGGKSRPLQFVGQVANAVTVLSTTVTIIPTDTNLVLPLTQMESSGYVIIPRPGNYTVSAFISLERDGSVLVGFEAYTSIEINGAGNLPVSPSFVSVVPTSSNGANSYAHVAVTQTRNFAANDSFALLSYQTTGFSFNTRAVGVVMPALSVTENPLW